MNTLALAKRRAALRHRDEGAVMFVVAMTIAVLASVGVYALAAAATEVRTSGNERQNTQTHYLAEYGVIGAAHEMTGPVARKMVDVMRSTAYQDTNCVSLQGVPTTAPASALWCLRKGAEELGANWTQPNVVAKYGTNNTAQPYTAMEPPGTFGSTPMDGDFFVELTEPMKLSSPSRYSTNSGACFSQITVTSVGYTRPVFPGVLNTTTAHFGGEGVETQRARLVALLIPCPQ